jgi:nitrite reductase/ring-hydroxylating ferredoxin subunit
LPSDGIWVSVLLEASLAVGTAQRVVIGPLSLIVGRTDEIVFAALDVCPHLELPFSSFGTLTLRNNRLVCPWHYWEFDVQSGQCEYAALYRDDEMFFRSRERIIRSAIPLVAYVAFRHRRQMVGSKYDCQRL